MNKNCKVCKETKPIEKFNITVKAKGYRDTSCRSCRLAAQRKYQKTEAGKLTLQKYNQSEEFKKSQQKYRQSERGIELNRLNAAKRYALQKQATPPWADLEAIKQFYLNCPKGMHVDHIIPLNGTEVSGFHVLENLQYLTPYENFSKGNKLLDKYKNGEQI